MPRRLCLGCRRTFAAGAGRAASRCRDCRRRHPHERSDWRRLARETVAAHVSRVGYVCPGWGREAHPADPASNPLTADHVVAVARGGTEGEGVAVLCRSCNSSKGAGPG